MSTREGAVLKPNGQFVCGTCLKSFCKKILLLQHVRRMHRAQFLTCHHCSYSTKFKFQLGKHMSVHFNLNRHRRGHSGRDRRKVPLLECPLCNSFNCKDRTDMIQHYTATHDVLIAERHIDFENYDEFENWKNRTQTVGCFRFVLFGKSKNVDGTSKSYRCFRDGFFMSKGESKRRLKNTGSCKMNGVCPCSLKVFTLRTTGAVRASYISCHVGHTVNSDGMDLSTAETRSNDVVVDTIRESMTHGDCSRIHLITQKDLTCAMDSFQVTDGRLHCEDQRSLEAWIRSVENCSNIVRFYKPQLVLVPEYPELQKEDFVLILSYDAQLELLRKFGPRMICVDGTHGTKGNNFELHTLLVKDTKNRGFPCAFLISNRSDSQVMTLFFKVIFSLMPQPIIPNALMTGMSEAYYSGWCAAMPQPDHWIVCQWHVDQAWRKKLNKINNAKKKCEVYKLLRTVMDEPDEISFKQLFELALTIMAHDPELADFEQYFSSQYSNNTRSWAFCYLKYLDINWNMMLDSMHKIIKYVYVDEKGNKSLDKGIKDLLQFVKDTLFDQLDGSTEEKLTAFGEWHVNMQNKENSIIPQESGWLITSSSGGKMIDVTRTDETCDCDEKCEECGVCIHKHCCSCSYSVKSNLCKRIRRIVTFCKTAMPAGRRMLEPKSERELYIVDDEGYLEMKILLRDPSAKNSLVKASSTCFDLEKAKESVSRDFVSILQSITNEEGIDILKKALASVPYSLQASKSRLPMFNPSEDS